jgi:hypothetical protein
MFCGWCKQEKDKEEFYITHKNQCKICARKAANKWNKSHFEHRQKYLKKYQPEYHKENPWIRIFRNINNRCNNPNDKRYNRYGGRGIKCLITEEEIKFLWFRDNASKMELASIDRIDNDGNYEINNCRFIEFKENSAKDRRIKILQYDLNGNFIKEYNSTKEAEKQTGFSHKCIGQVALNHRKTSYGFIWKYKEI